MNKNSIFAILASLTLAACGASITSPGGKNDKIIRVNFTAEGLGLVDTTITDYALNLVCGQTVKSGNLQEWQAGIALSKNVNTGSCTVSVSPLHVTTPSGNLVFITKSGSSSTMMASSGHQEELYVSGDDANHKAVITLSSFDLRQDAPTITLNAKFRLQGGNIPVSVPARQVSSVVQTEAPLPDGEPTVEINSALDRLSLNTSLVQCPASNTLVGYIGTTDPSSSSFSPIVQMLPEDPDYPKNMSAAATFHVAVGCRSPLMEISYVIYSGSLTFE